MPKLSLPARIIVRSARFSPQEVERLEALATEADVTVSRAIREGSLEWLEERVLRLRARREQLRLTE